MGLMDQNFGNLEGVVDIPLANEIVSSSDGSAAFPGAFGTGKLVQDSSRLIGQVAADNVRSTPVHQIPIVDSVVALYVEVEQFLPARLRCFLAAGLPIHNT